MRFSLIFSFILHLCFLNALWTTETVVAAKKIIYMDISVSKYEVNKVVTQKLRSGMSSVERPVPSTDVKKSASISSHEELRSRLSSNDYIEMPMYTKEAFELQEQGIIRVSFETDKNGRIKLETAVLDSLSENKLLKRMVLTSLSKWILPSLAEHKFILSFEFRI